ncbi:MAG: ComEC/Rec2 family competence protein, partial [Candidatus Poribacteria bacterium]|nr:ComEC/Rec2 family competence protein [Candidatus Poribacteria bacterium]
MSRPALHALIPYALGILVGGFSSIPIFWIWLTALACLVCSLILRNVTKQNFSIRPLPPITYRYVLLQLAVFACGTLYSEIRLTSPIPSDFYDQETSFSGKTLYQPERGESWDACFVKGQVRPLESPDRVVSAKLLVYFREPVSLHYGDHLELRGILRRPQGQRNPGGFDYRSYLARRQVFGVFYPERELEISPTGQSGFPFLRWTESLRRRVENVIDSVYHKHPEHVEILKGMLLGKRGGIEESTITAFRNSGSLHILAVSGLHVGLIAGVFFLCFSRLPAKATCILTILAVILYACIVGFRPSVFRASTMVILFLFGSIINRDVDRFNLLAVAALILLLINPAQMWDVGFQLSFAAVASILYLMPKWKNFIGDILPDW